MNIMNNENAIKLCDAVLKHVPEFREYKDFALWGKENPYLHFGNFGNFLVERIERSLENDPIVQRAVEFVNASYNTSNDEYIHTMLGTEVFEKLTVSSKTVAVAKKYLKDAALNHFDKALK